MNHRLARTYALAFAVALAAHVGVLRGLGDAARRARAHPRFAAVELEVRRIAPTPSTPPAPPPPAPLPEPEPKRRPPPLPPQVVAPIDLTREPPRTDAAPPPPNTDAAAAHAGDARPVFGISMSSVVGPGGNPSFAVRVGNTLLKAPEPELIPAEDVRPYAPVPMAKVTRMPVPRGPCQIPYPAQADELGVEGAVKLDVVVLADGSVGEVRLVQGVGFGLDEAAIAGIKKCRFAPARIGDDPVPTRIPYTYRFYIDR